MRAETEMMIERYTMNRGTQYPSGVVFVSKCWVSNPMEDALGRVPRKVKSIKFWVSIDDLNRMRAKTVTRHW